MNAIIKWPGGKSREIDMIKDLIPEVFDRYIEPFFGGGALYFHLNPRHAAINDLSAPLMNFYRQVKEQTFELKRLLYGYAESVSNLLAVCDENRKAIRAAFDDRQADSITTLLDDLLPQKLIPVLVEDSGIPPRQKVHDITREQRRTLLNLLKHFPVELAGPRPVTDAIITSGGVKTGEINPTTMESKLVKGLYFAGELIDVDAYTGGFNLQIAWATGRAAGLAAAQNQE